MRRPERPAVTEFRCSQCGEARNIDLERCYRCGADTQRVPVTLHAKALPSATPPPDPRQSELLRLLAALIDAAATGRPGIYLSAILREEERELRRRADWVIGTHTNRTATEIEYTPGIAGLSFQEYRAVSLFMEGFDVAEIARNMEPVGRASKRLIQLGTSGATISWSTADNYLQRGLNKVRSALSDAQVLEAIAG